MYSTNQFTKQNKTQALWCNYMHAVVSASVVPEISYNHTAALLTAITVVTCRMIVAGSGAQRSTAIWGHKGDETMTPKRHIPLTGEGNAYTTTQLHRKGGNVWTFACVERAVSAKCRTRGQPLQLITLQYHVSFFWRQSLVKEFHVLDLPFPQSASAPCPHVHRVGAKKRLASCATVHEHAVDHNGLSLCRSVINECDAFPSSFFANVVARTVVGVKSQPILASAHLSSDRWVHLSMGICAVVTRMLLLVVALR